MDVGGIRARLLERGWTLSVAESLTGGLLANRFAAAEGASEWFRGAVVAYASEVKHGLLEVPDGPVVSEVAARTMAATVARLLGAAVGVSTTGVGGPDPQEGQPPGTVWIGVSVDGLTAARRLNLEGDPESICHQSCDAAIDLLGEQLVAAG
ncbi:MAG: hypothetical protein JWM85_1765 [Acidimicrobiaceae bacterium]|nr:hypothetical protein [Acidimicrobiaceae bacterium]